MKETKLGQLIPQWDRVERDAIHIAVLPVVAGEWLNRGDWVRVDMVNEEWRAWKVPEELADKRAVGIVDPFLDRGFVKDGEKFWVCLKPGTVVGMRHHWFLPVLDESAEEKSEHEKWLLRFCDKWYFDYKELVREATSIDGEGHWATALGKDLHGAEELGEDHELFWFHLERLTGLTFDGEHREKFGWSCSC